MTEQQLTTAAADQASLTLAAAGSLVDPALDAISNKLPASE